MSDTPSPCVGVCRYAAHGRWCEGCGRSPQEISDWRDLDEAARRRIAQSSRARLAAARRDERAG